MKIGYQGREYSNSFFVAKQIKTLCLKRVINFKWQVLNKKELKNLFFGVNMLFWKQLSRIASWYYYIEL